MDSLVIHLYHENGSISHNNENGRKLVEINRLKYEELKKKQNNNINWRNM